MLGQHRARARAARAQRLEHRDQAVVPLPLEIAVGLLGRHASGLVPGEVVAFEDTEAGVASAKAAGVHCVALAGTLPRARLGQADEIVETIDEPLLRRLLEP